MGSRSLKRMKQNAAELTAYFGATTPIIQITEPRIDAYIRDRLEAKKARATVNRALGVLRRAYRLGLRKKLVQSMPTITLLDDSDNVRQGFFEPAEIEAVLAYLAPALQPLVPVCRTFRVATREILTLLWSDVDRDGRVIRLRHEHSKNKDARVLALEGELWTLIEQRWAERRVTTTQGQDALATHVFHRRGKPIKEFRGAWGRACAKANVPGRLFHDCGAPPSATWSGRACPGRRP